MLRKILFTLYILVVMCMGTATFIEKSCGSEITHAVIYSSPWFTTLWILLATTSIAYIVRRRLRRLSILMLHGALLLILTGALATHLSAIHGTIHLRCGEAVNTFTADDQQHGSRERTLPFTLRLDRFDIKYHTGTAAEADYVSYFTIIDNGQETHHKVSMNNICSYRSVRFCQTSYDRDMAGSILTINNDPYGIPLTYAGYALLLISLIWVLADPHTSYRRLLRSPLLKRGALILIMTVSTNMGAQAINVLPENTAEKIGQLYVVYDNRICPLQTLAIDFTRKLYGHDSYKGYTAEQVLTGFIFWGDEWCGEPIFKVKEGPLSDCLQLPRYCSINTFFNRDMGGYILGPYIQEYYQGSADAFHKQAADLDDRLMMVMNLRRGTLLKIFPITTHSKTVWYAPTDALTDSIVGTARRAYIQNIFSLIYTNVKNGNYPAIDHIVDKMQIYQLQNAGSSLPSTIQTQSERIYNSIPFTTVLSMANLLMGLLILIFTAIRPLYQWINTHPIQKPYKIQHAMPVVVSLLSFLGLTVCLILRWIASDRIPMASGYETMLVMAWFIMLFGLILYSRFRIAIPFSLLMSGFFLLVSHISQMDPHITHVMPVLASPLLGIHVSVIMMSFALLSLTFLCGITAISTYLIYGRLHSVGNIRIESLALLSRLMLYPAVVMLAIGIFIGAVWANVSWGSYWNWDAKEVWGLITLMVYAIALHDNTLPFLKRPMGYHLFITGAFLTLLMTYFGVNYFLGGMHSYA